MNQLGSASIATAECTVLIKNIKIPKLKPRLTKAILLEYLETDGSMERMTIADPSDD